MKTAFFIILAIGIASSQAPAQSSYNKDLAVFRASYISKHEVVKGKDKEYFRFFPINSSYKIKADFEKITDTIGFTMTTSNGGKQVYYKYGRVSFKLRDTALQLYLYQSKALLYTSYKDYLFIPFTDLTTGDVSYGSGRYLDFLIGDIKEGKILVDFNKAYNPYCAYANGFQCPIPPKENDIPVMIKAGEKTFAKPIH